MNKTLAAAIAALLAFGPAQAAPAGKGAPQFDISLQYLSSIGTDASVGSTGAEIVSYDRKTRRAFAINSQDNDLAVIDLSNPAAPILLEKLPLDVYGAGLNGVDTHEGLVAVAVEASPKTDPGKVVFLDARTLAVRGAVTVGALPDMLTFDDDGQRVLVANEGEPESYLAGAVEPGGLDQHHRPGPRRREGDGADGRLPRVQQGGVARHGRAGLRARRYRGAGPRARVHHPQGAHRLGDAAGG